MLSRSDVFSKILAAGRIVRICQSAADSLYIPARKLACNIFLKMKINNL